MVEDEFYELLPISVLDVGLFIDYLSFAYYSFFLYFGDSAFLFLGDFITYLFYLFLTFFETEICSSESLLSEKSNSFLFKIFVIFLFSIIYFLFLKSF